VYIHENDRKLSKYSTIKELKKIQLFAEEFDDLLQLFFNACGRTKITFNAEFTRANKLVLTPNETEDLNLCVFIGTNTLLSTLRKALPAEYQIGDLLFTNFHFADAFLIFSFVLFCAEMLTRHVIFGLPYYFGDIYKLGLEVFWLSLCLSYAIYPYKTTNLAFPLDVCMIGGETTFSFSVIRFGWMACGFLQTVSIALFIREHKPNIVLTLVLAIAGNMLTTGATLSVYTIRHDSKSHVIWVASFVIGLSVVQLASYWDRELNHTAYFLSKPVVWEYIAMIFISFHYFFIVAYFFADPPWHSRIEWLFIFFGILTTLASL